MADVVSAMIPVRACWLLSTLVAEWADIKFFYHVQLYRPMTGYPGGFRPPKYDRSSLFLTKLTELSLAARGTCQIVSFQGHKSFLLP